MSARQAAEKAQTKPYKVTRDGAIIERATGTEIGQVHRNDYGWNATLYPSGKRSHMHETRAQAVAGAWALHLSLPPGASS